MSNTSRRSFCGQATLGLPSLALAEPAGQPAPMPEASRRVKVVCVGAHPDDPESGCGGTLARYVDAGHRVTVVYLTRGEGGVRGKSQAEAARIRTAEAEAACKILGARA